MIAIQPACTGSCVHLHGLRLPTTQLVANALLCFCQSLLHRSSTHRPLGIFKYAMTLDGKIATSMGHSAWVSSSLSRQQVFETRARSDAVIVGGQTVRVDNPRLTTRRDGGHMPVRIVMSRTLDLQEVRFQRSTACRCHRFALC